MWNVTTLLTTVITHLYHHIYRIAMPVQFWIKNVTPLAENLASVLSLQQHKFLMWYIMIGPEDTEKPSMSSLIIGGSLSSGIMCVMFCWHEIDDKTQGRPYWIVLSYVICLLCRSFEHRKKHMMLSCSIIILEKIVNDITGTTIYPAKLFVHLLPQNITHG